MTSISITAETENNKSRSKVNSASFLPIIPGTTRVLFYYVAYPRIPGFYFRLTLEDHIKLACMGIPSRISYRLSDV